MRGCPAAFKSWKRKIIEAANANRTFTVRAILASAEIVAAVWPDPKIDDGIAVLVIKGQRSLRSIIEKRQACQVSTAAFWCAGKAEAIALRDAINDHQFG